MDVTAATSTPEMFTITISGTFTFNRNCRVRNTPFMADAGVATYVTGESVNYDSKVKNDNHLWLSYIGTSGNRVYVDYANIANNEYFGTDTNSTDPIQAGSEPTTGEGLGTLYGQEGANHADATPDGTTYTTTGNFTYTTNGAYGRETTLMDSQGIDHIVVNSTVPYTAKIKADNHYWLKYVSANDGKTYYVPYATIVDSTTGVLRYYGEDSNWGDPVYASGGSTSTGGGLPTPSDQENLGELTGAEGAAVANQTADGTVLDSQGHMGIVADVNVYETPDINSTVIDTLAGGNDIYYEAKVKSGNYYWACYSPNDDGHYVYFPYAQISPFVSYVTDENPGDPVYTTGSGDNDGREQGGQHMDYSLSGATPLSDLDGYEFPMSGWVIMNNGAQERTTPDFTNGTKGTKHQSTTKYADRLSYVAKTNGVDDHRRIWVKLKNGNYLPIAQLAFLNNLKRNDDGALSSTISNADNKAYVQDQNTNQVYEMIWPYTKIVAGKKKDGNAIENIVPEWEKDEGSIVHETVSDYFTPDKDEQAQLAALHAQVVAGKHSDDVIIAYITDTHFDSYATPASARVLHSMKLMSWYAKTYPVDLVVHGGDLNDGVKDKNLSRIDVEQAVDAIKISHRPYIILQGNHDDNSGYVRDMAGYQEDQLLTNSEAWSLRQSPVLNRVTGADNPNDAVFGTYDIPDSDITVIVLDGFDQPDIHRYGDDNGTHWKSFRHGYTRYSDQQVSWLKQTLNNLPQDRKVLFINHIALNGVPVGAENGGWNTLGKSEEAYTSGLFEYNDGTDKSDVAGSRDVYTAITNFEARTGNVIGYLSGHTHADNNAYSGGVQFITQTAGIADRGGDRGDTGSVDTSRLTGYDNNAWTILRISKSAGTVDQFRFGWQNQVSFKNHWNF